MFGDRQIQNPFLKPSPFAASSALPTSYSASSSNFPPRYQSYKPYDQPKPTYRQNPKPYQNYDSYESYRPSHSPGKAFQSKDMTTILSNNPFNRSFQPSFAVQKASRQLSPAKRSTSPLNHQSSYNYEGYGSSLGSYEASRVSSSTNGKKTQNPNRFTPARNNYLSTSSADSATTYINKIYELQEDRVSQKQSKNLSNPFFRKNLLSINQTQRQTIKQPLPASNPFQGYSGSSNLQYGGYGYQQKRSLSPAFGQDQYSSDKYDKPASQKYGNLNRGISFSQDYDKYDKYDKYDQYEPKIGEDKTKYGISEDDVRITSNFGVEMANPFADKKYQKYEYKPSKDYQKDYQQYKPSKEYQRDYQQPKFGTKQSNQTYPFKTDYYDQPQSSKYIDSKYAKDSYQKSWKLSKQEKDSYNFRPPYQDSYKPENNYNPRRQEQRVKFQSQGQSSKYQSYKGYRDNYQMANPQRQYQYQRKDQRQYEYERRDPIGNSFGGYQKDSNKLASSNVDQYTSPEDIQKKIKENKYQKLGLENPSLNSKPRSSNNIVRFDQNDDQYDNPAPTLNKAPTRDSAQQFPRVLQFNGVLFHKIEVM